MLSDKFRFCWLNNFVPTWILFFVVAAAPFPFGSKSNTAIAFWCALLSVAVASTSTLGLRRELYWIITGILLIAAGYGFVLHDQLSDHPWLAPFSPVWKEASEGLGVSLAPSASVIKNKPFFALGPPMANMMSLLLGLVIGYDRSRAYRIVSIIAWSGACYALYGIASFLFEPTMILWREKTFYVDNVTGTFINRNTAAIYFGSCCVVLLLSLVAKIRRRIPEHRIIWRHLIGRLSELPAKEFLPPLAAFFTCLTAMFLTGSRAGTTLSLLAMIVGFIVLLRKDFPPRTGVWVALGFAVTVALGLMQFLGGQVSSRFDFQGLADEGRIEAWRSTLRIIADYPLFGTGLGTFASSFPLYRSSNVSMQGVWDLAHSTPLELASEVGLPLAFLVGFGWLAMFFITARGVSVRRRNAMLPLSAVCISALALLHSSLDFTLQIPGYSIPFFALFGMGMAQSFRSTRPSDSPEGDSTKL
jgi:hypothetical protein